MAFGYVIVLIKSGLKILLWPLCHREQQKKFDTSRCLRFLYNSNCIYIFKQIPNKSLISFNKNVSTKLSECQQIKNFRTSNISLILILFKYHSSKIWLNLIMQFAYFVRESTKFSSKKQNTTVNNILDE